MEHTISEDQYTGEAVAGKTAVRPAWLWGLWNGRCWIRATDTAGDPILVYLTEADAREGARSHLEWHDIECVPVCLDLARQSDGEEC